MFYQPGLLFGGTIEHDCNPQRSIGYYLEALLMLAPFMKTTLKATLKGVTNDPTDPSVRRHTHTHTLHSMMEVAQPISAPWLLKVLVQLIAVDNELVPN